MDQDEEKRYIKRRKIENKKIIFILFQFLFGSLQFGDEYNSVFYSFPIPDDCQGMNI